MNEQDRNEIKKLGVRIGNLEKAVEKILKNHLPHLNMKLNITLGGLVFIAVMIALLACMIAFRAF